MKIYGDLEFDGDSEVRNVTFNSQFVTGDRVRSTDADGKDYMETQYGEVTGAELRGGEVHYTVAWDGGIVTTVPASYIQKV